MIDQEMRNLALQAFRDTLTDANAKPADKLRAAEAIARMDVSEKTLGKESDMDATDDELLKRARGEATEAANELALRRWLTE